MGQAGQSAKDRAVALAQRWPLEIAPPVVLSYLRNRCLTVACSGGADSVALLLWLAGHRPTEELQVVHIHHGVRGAEADADAAFVEALAQDLGVACRVIRVAVESVSEASLRTARLEALRSAATGKAAETAFVFAHHADDVLENLLFRMVRGGQLSSLAGMRAIQDFEGNRPPHLRPLLELRRDEIRERLREVRQPWREDTSNASSSFTRNRLRHEVVPALQRVFEDRDLAVTALNLHREVGEVDAWMSGLVKQALSAASDREVSLAKMQDWPVAMRRRFLVTWLQHHEIALPRRELLEKIVAADGHLGESWTVAPGWRLEVTGGRWRLHEDATELAPKWGDVPQGLVSGSALAFPDGGLLKAVERRLSPEEVASIQAGSVNARWEAYLALAPHEQPAIQVRRWRPGDRYYPLGAPGRRKLQDCFVDRRIAEPLRHRLPVIVAENGEILWVPGLEPAHDRRLATETTRALWLTYHRA